MHRFYVFNTEDFNKRYAYTGDDLGCTVSKRETTFKFWAPMANDCQVILYGDGYLGGPVRRYDMQQEDNGVWVLHVKENLENYYYNYGVCYQQNWDEVVDPYAKATGVNGLRGMVVEPSRYDPIGWKRDEKRARIPAKDAIIYEGHVRDLTVCENSGVKKKGLFLGLTEKKTKNDYGMPTGLDYMKQLGVTHVHLMPVNDYATIDESKPLNEQYNWGYDPKHFSVPEGSYATNPYDGGVRIREFKEMVLAMHKQGLNVILDVVYNHTYWGVEGDLYRAFPGYYYRFDENGVLTNGSGCGNELATDRFMVRKMIIDSILYWVKEYHVDGFRLDLMGVYDLDTLREMRAALDAIDPAIVMYGEPWIGGASALNPEKAGFKHNLRKLPDSIGAFSDDIRDAIKGDVFHADAKGYVHGNIRCRESVKLGIVGAVEHPGVNPAYLFRANYFWTNSPLQSINYVSAHDNYTLYDKLKACEPSADDKRYVQLGKLCAAMVMTSQGVPFFSAGEEFLRTKNGDHNSYRSLDAVNQMDWNRQKEYADLVAYYKGLITLRKEHPAFRMETAEAVREHLEFFDTENNQFIIYCLKNHANGDAYEKIAVLFHVGETRESVMLPEGNWKVLVNEKQAGTAVLEEIAGNEVWMDGPMAMVLVK